MFLLSTDIDGTIYDGPESARAFAEFWGALSERLPSRPLLAYNTGRSLEDTRGLVEDTNLPQPDWFICDVGTTIFDVARSEILGGWRERLSPGWDFAAVHEIVSQETPAEPQSPESQGEFKCSWFWHDATASEIDALERLLREAEMNAQAIYSSNRDLDLLPANGNKGNAVAFLAAEIRMAPTRIIVAGDSGNDASMFLVEDVRGIVVANADDALRRAVAKTGAFHASSPSVRGVIEGIAHHWEDGTSVPKSQSRA